MVIGEHPNPLVRDQYLMQVASLVGSRSSSSARGLSSRVPGLVPPLGATDEGRRPTGARASAAPGWPSTVAPAPVCRRRDSPEVEALRLLLGAPDEIGPRLHERLFADEVNLEAYRALVAAADLHEAVGATDEDAGDLLQRLAVEDTEAEVDDVMARLAEEAALRQHAIMQLDLATADESEVIQRGIEMAEIKRCVEQLHDPATSAAAVDQLLAWLAGRPQESQ